MVILEAASLKNSLSLYDYKEFKIDSEEIDNRLSDLFWQVLINNYVTKQ